jgi:hypothetical protein
MDHRHLDAVDELMSGLGMKIRLARNVWSTGILPAHMQILLSTATALGRLYLLTKLYSIDLGDRRHFADSVL